MSHHIEEKDLKELGSVAQDLEVGDFKQVADFNDSAMKESPSMPEESDPQEEQMMKGHGLKQEEYFKGQALELSLSDFPQLEKENFGDKVMLVVVGPLLVKDNQGVKVGMAEVAFVHGKLPKLGSGERFSMLVNKISSRPGFKPRNGQSKEQSAGAIAASIGRAKYGNKKFQSLAVHAKRRSVFE